MNTLTPKIAELIAEEELRSKEWNERNERNRKESAKTERYIRSLPFRQATPNEYIEWLRGYFENGGTPTHYYKYPIPDYFVVATNDFALTDSMCGALSMYIIVPKGVTCLSGRRGHCMLYYMDGFRVDGGFVPVFNNTTF